MALPRKLIYPAVFSYDDVDGCYSQADSTEEALYMAKDALELVLEDYISSMFEDAPKSSQIKDIKVESNQCVALIEVDVDQLIKRNSSKTINKTLTLPSWLTELGIKNKLNFSKILQDGIKKELGI
ncbi:type II toxin-antitoxin system HicB family antitoxin [Thomasclavelia cocleata]|jgi:predicted RNase H-like HicB family nuclease|uniref:type II toxin-antitoxin system HicB family antitoxin n=1 Tax=Thomasclavelia cocleata TaxID=69824 RepID=UPI00241EA8D3|nr:type II toxin-antitoxin system HicB family antitoxin [Thomasclavelia cocleata]